MKNKNVIEEAVSIDSKSIENMAARSEISGQQCIIAGGLVNNLIEKIFIEYILYIYHCEEHKSELGNGSKEN